jgi:predicted Rossmann fold flavoprotein
MTLPATLTTSTDIAIVGAGAAGLATAIFAMRAHPRTRTVLFESARTPGAKILVSGGGRCNVTNSVVSETDFWGGKATIVRRVLRGLPVPETVRFFGDLGVSLHEEAGGKLFPDTNRARDVVEALLRGVHDAGVDLLAATRVTGIGKHDGGFVLGTSAGDLRARAVVLATGGRSLPKTGSDGGGYALAAALGHTIVPPTPALAPLLLDPATPYSVHARLQGVAMDAEITAWVDGIASVRLRGALLWTHFGISGPVALNASRHWARAKTDERPVRLSLSMYPGLDFERVDDLWLRAAADRPQATLRGTLAAQVPEAAAAAVLDVLLLPPDRTLSALTREDRRRIVHAVTEWPLPVTDTRGYNFAEVTSGGVALTEIDPATMESRVCPGLYLVGEILDVDGRIGGFNFQWAWSTAALAGRAVNSSTPQRPTPK